MSGQKRPPLVAEKRYPAQKKKPVKKATTKTKKKAVRKPKTPKRPRGPIGALFAFVGRIFKWIVRLLWGFGWRVGMIVGLAVGVAALYVAMTLPPVTDLVDGRARGSVTMLDRFGDTYAWRGDQFGGMVTAGTVSPHLKNALVATEDKRFYRHFGISPRGIASAVRINLREGRGPLSGHGGSTITQQTAKLLCLGQPFDPEVWKNETAYEADCRRTTLWRKIKEMTYAMGMEIKYTKDEILTVYLNRAFLGAGARGFEAASQRYFGISAGEVNPAQASMMVGLLVAPTRYAPTNNLKRSQNRSQVVVRLMETQGYLSASAAQNAIDNPATLSPAAQARAGGYFADWVMSTGPKFLTRDTTEDVIIKTTLDQTLQTAAEDAMKFVFDNKVRQGSEAQAAIVVMSADGAVRAMVGGRQTKVTGAFNRATQAKRQTGSAFKPFVFAAALELGYSPNDLVQDAPICIHTPGSGEWCPKNYKDEFKGPVSMTDALVESLNTPAVRISESVGRDLVKKVATGFGIDNKLADGPALALGASESTLLEMTGAYAGILNGGSAVDPYGLVELRLLGDDEPMARQDSGIRERIITRDSAESLTWMMHQVIEQGTGQRAKLGERQVAGKTGTTQAARDAWFIGFTGNYVTGVWMGYDDNTPLTGVTGSGLPADIWRETMTRITATAPVTPLPMKAPPAAVPDPIVEAPQPKPQNQETAIESLLRSIFSGGN